MASPRAAVYRITPHPAAPSLRILSHDMGIFDGTQKAPLSPRAPFRGAITAPPSATQFYALAPGVLAISEAACSSLSGRIPALKNREACGLWRGAAKP